MGIFKLIAASFLIAMFVSGCAGKSMIEDSDGDGVADNLDNCPGTPRIAYHTVDANGCPTNSDGDDVPDYLDRCPDTAAGVKVDPHGCPDEVPVSIVANINFDFDSAAIRKDAAPKLDRVASLMQENGNVNVTVVGHTDSIGDESYNQGLSERRADSVKKYLEGQGVSGGRMGTDGKGETEPLVSNDTKSGRAVNRRVEFVTAN